MFIFILNVLKPAALRRKTHQHIPSILNQSFGHVVVCCIIPPHSIYLCRNLCISIAQELDVTGTAPGLGVGTRTVSVPVSCTLEFNLRNRSTGAWPREAVTTGPTYNGDEPGTGITLLLLRWRKAVIQSDQ